MPESERIMYRRLVVLAVGATAFTGTSCKRGSSAPTSDAGVVVTSVTPSPDSPRPLGTPTVIASKQGRAKYLRIQGDYVYWSVLLESMTGHLGDRPLRPLEGALVRAPKAGGPISMVAKDKMMINGFFIDGPRVYWTGFGGRVSGATLDGSDDGTLRLAPSVAGMTVGLDIVAASHTLIWGATAMSAGEILRMPIDGGSTSVLVHGPVPSSIVTDGSFLYWTDLTDKSVKKCPIGGGVPVVLASGQKHPLALAVDDANVYWADSEAGRILRCTKGGGIPFVLSSDQVEPTALAIDGTNLYWTDRKRGTIMRVALGGGTPIELVSGQDGPDSIAVDETAIYWANGGTGELREGDVMKRLKPRGPVAAVSGSIGDTTHGQPTTNPAADDPLWIPCLGTSLTAAMSNLPGSDVPCGGFKLLVSNTGAILHGLPRRGLASALQTYVGIVLPKLPAPTSYFVRTCQQVSADFEATCRSDAWCLRAARGTVESCAMTGGQRAASWTLPAGKILAVAMMAGTKDGGFLDFSVADVAARPDQAADAEARPDQAADGWAPLPWSARAPSPVAGSPTAPSKASESSTPAAAADGNRVDLAPDDAAFVDTRGGRGWADRCWMHIRSGQLGWAKAECDKAMDMTPASPMPLASLLYNEGLIEQKLGNKEAARSYYQRSLALRPHAIVQGSLDSLDKAP
jgi:hypothetical protein